MLETRDTTERLMEGTMSLRKKKKSYSKPYMRKLNFTCESKRNGGWAKRYKEFLTYKEGIFVNESLG